MQSEQQNTLTHSPIKNIVIVGGDVLGWCAAVGLARGLQGQGVKITVVDLAHHENLNPHIIHASEHIFDFHRLLGIQDKPLLVNGHGKLCLGAKFRDFHPSNIDTVMGCDRAVPTFSTIELHQVLSWLGLNEPEKYSLSCAAIRSNLLAVPSTRKGDISSSFSPALNLDGMAYLRFMQGAAKHLGVEQINTRTIKVVKDKQSDFITQVELPNGQIIDVDLLVDNTNDSALVTSAHTQREYTQCSEYLSFDRVMTGYETNATPACAFQQFQGLQGGWVEITTMSKLCTATLHYSSKLLSDAAAKQSILSFIPDGKEIRVREQSAQYLNNPLDKNHLIIGQGAGYLGSSPISQLILLQRSISKLLELFPSKGCLPANSAELNRRIQKDYQEAAHYGALFIAFEESYSCSSYPWQLSIDQLPAGLKQKARLFQSSGRVASELNPLISRDTWVNLLKHKIKNTHGYEPVLDALDKHKGKLFLTHLDNQIQQCTGRYRQYS